MVNELTSAYEPHHNVLKNLTFTAPAGEVTYITGRSGVGKTTLFKLLLGSITPTKGHILLQMRSGQQERLAPELITYVSQKPFLFNGTIGENIALDENPDRDRLAYAVSKSALSDLLDSFAAGYDYVIRDGDKQLSGGQRCRVAIARAFYSSAPIVLLDEVFASLDNKTIETVKEAIKELAGQGRCVLLISHRHEWIDTAARRIELA